MDVNIEKYTERINKWDWLLIIGLILSPMTDFRIWKIGPSELLCFIWGLKYFPKKVYQMNILSSFLLRFLAAMIIGTMIGLIVAPEELILSDLLTWFFLTFIALAMYEGLTINSNEYNERLLMRFILGSVVWYILLYFYSIYVSKTFIGARLWYIGVRFTGGANNPHQIAVLMCGITFCFVRNLIKKRNILVNLMGMIGAIFIEIQTASSTGIMAIFLGFIATAMILTFYRMELAKAKIYVLVIELIVGLLIIAISYPILNQYIYKWISSDANGIGRLELFAQIGNTFHKSPLFGLGPGTHATWKTYPKEFHNTYLEIIAATGIYGFITFVVFTMKSIKKMMYDPTLLPIIVAIYAYGLAGFAMRRLAYWGLFTFVLVVAENHEICSVENRGENELL